MPINFFKRSKKEKEKEKASKVEPNEAGSSYAAAQYNPSATKAEYKYNKYDNKEESRPPVAVAAAAAAAADDPYAFLSDFDTVFLIDDSGSMSIGKRWEQTRMALEAIVPICTAHDADGIDIYFLNKEDNSNQDFLNVTSLDAVKEIFGKVSPSGVTYTGKRLDDILSPYLEKLVEQQQRAAAAAAGETETTETTETNKINTIIKPLNIIVITDGCPTDEARLESVIVKAAKELDRLEAPGWQVGVQFFQVGGDKDATRSLILLDDMLKEKFKIRDMVDTVPWKEEDDSGSGSGSGSGGSFDGAFILKVVTGAVNRRLDRKVV